MPESLGWTFKSDMPELCIHVGMVWCRSEVVDPDLQLGLYRVAWHGRSFTAV